MPYAPAMPEHAHLRSVWERLIAARRVLLVSPQHPDGDSVGSICGLGLALADARGDALGAGVVLTCPDPIPQQYDSIPGVHAILKKADAERHGPYDVVVVVDASDATFAGIAEDAPRWRECGATLVVIDHHATNTMYGDVNLVLRASSTTQIIAQMLDAVGVRLTPQVATALYFGLVTDTDSFTNPGTTPAAVAIAASLVAAGARPGPVLRSVYQRKPLASLQLWGRALARLRLHPRYGVAMCVLLPEDFARCDEDVIEQADGLSNFLQTVLPVRAICVLKDRGDGMVRGSLRTTRDGVNVSALARRLGGGGHTKAAGFGIPGKIVLRGTTWRVVPPVG